MARTPATIAKKVTPSRCPKGCLFLETESTSPKGRGVWYARVPAEHTIEDVLHPDYFGLAKADKGLRAGDVIDIEPEHGLWFIRARVMSIREDLSQAMLREFSALREDYEVAAPDGYEFKWQGAQGCWTVYKGQVAVGSGFLNHDECRARVDELQRERAA